MRFCTYCGFALSGAPRSCAGCGTPIDQALASGPPHALTSPVGWPPTPPPGQGPPDVWGRQDAPDPLVPQDTPGPWAPQDTPDPLAWPNTPGSWGVRDTPGPRTEEQPLSAPAAPDLFGDMFAADRPRTAPLPEYLPATGLLTGESPRSRRTPHRSPRSAGRGVMIIAIVATMASLATGGVGAWWITNHHAGLRPTASRLQSPSAGASSPGTSRATPGSDAVAIAPALTGAPDARPVAALLTSYFGAINSHNFAEYSALFIPQIRGNAQHFSAGYRSTTDSGATLAGLSTDAAQDVAAAVTFTSHQKAADSPDNATCDQWTVVLSLERTGSGFLITRSPAGYHPSVHACR